MSCCEKEDAIQVPAVQIGKKIPELSINVYDPESGDFAEVSFADLRKRKKWVVLFFYPADFTFVCPTELADLAEQHSTLKGLGVEVISLSCDTKFAHMAWRNSERLLSGVKYGMGEDPTGLLARLFGIYDRATGLAFRGTFIINPDGVLVGSEVNFNNVGRNAKELVRKVKANVYLADHPAEVCPARWEQGESTLTPSAAIVGNIYDALKK
ncbi:MAG: redoxin domain-containing protein [Desulfovibrio sp.]|nr:redoxin domain-containing protein [Desulfovibrio sp.]